MMAFCSCGMVFPDLVSFLVNSNDSVCRFQRFVQMGDQRDADEIGTGIDAVRFARQEAAGQNGDIIVAIQGLREGGIGDGSRSHR